MTILYEVGTGLYVNVTNRCPCNCTFCLRSEGDGAYGSNSLWLEHEPSVEEIIKAFENTDLSKYTQIVFCGYGEPLTRIDAIVEVCKYLKQKTNLSIRVNTNGLSDLIHNKPTAHLLKGYVDQVSISLNAPTAEEYEEVTRPRFGIQSFEAMLKFAADAKREVGDVTLTVVDVIGKEKVEASRKIAEAIGVKFRVREFI